MRKGTIWIWSGECVICFREMEEHLTSTPILTLPKVGELYTRYIDISGEGYGGVIMQNDRVIAYIRGNYNLMRIIILHII